MKIVPFKKEHLNVIGHSLLIKDYILHKYGKEYEQSQAMTILNNDDVPIGSVGLMVLWPGVGEAWTVLDENELSRHKLFLCRFIKKILNDAVKYNNLNRLQATCEAHDSKKANWLEFFGFKFESVLHKYGPDGKDYLMFCRVEE